MKKLIFSIIVFSAVLASINYFYFPQLDFRKYLLIGLLVITGFLGLIASLAFIFYTIKKKNS